MYMLIENKYSYLHFTRTRRKFTQRTTSTVSPLKQCGLGKCVFPGPLMGVQVLKITNLGGRLTGDSNNVSKLEQT